ncbi:hypothetical protein Lepto7375DRAFT_5065 [Leptolyngbya sp. PCC 7375]|nr:hypothetical protein Lepto7375DRAFT_5065 [Leptolyngbya sp. PCC 7375]
MQLGQPVPNDSRKIKMRNYHQDNVKVAVYSAKMDASEQQRSQDMVLAILMILSAVTVMGLRMLF